MCAEPSSVLEPGQIVEGPLFNEPMRVETIRPAGAERWAVGLAGPHREPFRGIMLTRDDGRPGHSYFARDVDIDNAGSPRRIGVGRFGRGLTERRL